MALRRPNLVIIAASLTMRRNIQCFIESQATLFASLDMMQNFMDVGIPRRIACKIDIAVSGCVAPTPKPACVLRLFSSFKFYFGFASMCRPQSN